MLESTERTRVVQIITTMSAGGATETVISAAIGLRELGFYDITVLGGPPIESEGGLIETTERLGIDFEIVPSMSREIDPVADVRALQHIYQRLRDLDCAIVHTHTTKAGLLGRLAGRLAGVPVITHTFHAFPYPLDAPVSSQLFFRITEQFASRWSSGLLSVSRDMIHRAVNDRLTPPGTCFVARSGMDLAGYLGPKSRREEIRRSWGISADAVAIGIIGRVYENYKGQDRLVRLTPKLIEQVPNLHVVIIGTGPSVEDLRAESEQLGVADHVHFVSYPQEEMPEVVGALDMVVLISTREGLARVIVQALACQLPVISWNRDGSPEVIHERHNGRLIESYDDNALIDAIVELARDPDLRKTWGERGPAAVDPEWRNENMVRQIHENYRAMLKRVGLTAPPPVEVPPYETWNMG